MRITHLVVRLAAGASLLAASQAMAAYYGSSPVLPSVHADNTGANDATNAANTALALGFSFFAPGTYLLNGSVTPPVNVPLEGAGTIFTGNGAIYNTGDYTALKGVVSSHWWTRTTNYPGNDWGTFTGLTINKTSTSQNYEKAAGYDVVTTSDPSSYTSQGAAANLLLDAVGRQMNANIAVGNTTGRAWGASSNVGIPSGADGTAIGFEGDITNNSGNDQPLPSTPNSKTGMTAVCIGNTKCTSGFFPIANGAQFHVGYDGVSSYYSDYFLALRSASNLSTMLASIDPSGNIKAQAGSFAGNLSTNGGALSLGNATSNLVSLGNVGLSGPGGAGEKIQLFGTPGSPSASDYQLFVSSGLLGISTPGSFAVTNGSFAKLFTIDSSGHTTNVAAEDHAIVNATASGTFSTTTHNVAVAGSFGSNGAIGAMTANITWTLPACTTALGTSASSRTYGLKLVGAPGSYTLTLAAASGNNSQTGVPDTIDGQTSTTVTSQYSEVNVQCDTFGHWDRGFY